MGEACADARDSLVLLFEAQAKRTPNAIALEDGATLVTYQELNENANLLAHLLIQAGAGPEARVGLYVESGARLVTAMLAAWKAGAAFVPFDVNTPPRRLEMLCKGAGLLLILTNRALQPQLTNLNLPLIAVDDTVANCRVSNANVQVSAQNLAYLIFTSGTTGVPKAVAIEHASLANMIRWAIAEIGPTSTDRSAQIVAAGFDAIFVELWPYLLTGGTICFPGRLNRQSPEQLQHWLLLSRVTVIMAPTPLGEALLALDWPGNCSVRMMIVGGDRLRKYPDPSHPFQLLNAYGPTENTVVSTAAIVPAAPAPTLPAIGRAIPGQGTGILDENLGQVPAGVIGELYLIGEGLARCYHGDPALTAARFVPCPYSPVPGARMFRSGDFALYTPGGDIEFVGRQDRQIKILGCRVDLAEIEACLLHHSDIRDVAVVTNELPDRQPFMTAYVVVDGQGGRDLMAARHDRSQALIASIRTFAAARLPSYMCPPAYHIVAALPMTENGKLDLRLLRETAAHDARPKNLSQDEQRLAGIFRDLLGIASVGPDSDFFACGGHSLLAARLVREIGRNLHVDIAIAEIYQHSRLSRLAELIGARRAAGCGQTVSLPSSVVPIQTSGLSPAFFCVAPAGGSPLCYRKLASCLAKDRQFFGLQSQGLGDNLPPLTSVEAIAAAHVAALRQAQPNGAYHIGGWSFGAIVAWEMAVQLTEQGQRVEQLALLDGWVGPRRYANRGAQFLESGAVAAMGFRFLRQIKLPRNYDGVRELAQWVGIGLPNSLAYLRHATWGARAAALRKMTDEAYRSLRVFTANAKAALRYRPRLYPGDCVFYRSNLDGPILRADRVVDEVRELTGGTFEVVTLDATHMSLMMQDDHIAQLAAALALQLRTARAGAVGAVAA